MCSYTYDREFLSPITCHYRAEREQCTLETHGTHTTDAPHPTHTHTHTHEKEYSPGIPYLSIGLPHRDRKHHLFPALGVIHRRDLQCKKKNVFLSLSFISFKNIENLFSRKCARSRSSSLHFYDVVSCYYHSVNYTVWLLRVLCTYNSRVAYVYIARECSYLLSAPRRGLMAVSPR